MKRKSELYDPESPESDTDEEYDNEEKKKEEEEDKPIEPASKIQKVPIKIAVIGKRPDVPVVSVDKQADNNEKPISSASSTNKNGASSLDAKSSSSVRLNFHFLILSNEPIRIGLKQK